MAQQLVWTFLPQGAPHFLPPVIPAVVPGQLAAGTFVAAGGQPYGAQVLAAMVGTAKPCHGCHGPRTGYPCSCGSNPVVPTRKTHDLSTADWRRIQKALCEVIISMVPPTIMVVRQLAGTNLLVLFRSVTDWVADLQAACGLQRIAPYDTAYVESSNHPVTGAPSKDAREDRRQERVQMNRLRHQMMNWGHSWIRTVGGDVQYQVAHVALHYIYILQNIPSGGISFEADGSISEYH